MVDSSHGNLITLGQLAREYQQKYSELQEFCRNAQPESIAHQLKLRAELTTDRFRAAQQALFAMLAPESEGGKEDMHGAVTALCRCFDEMRILFQILLEYTSKSEE